MNLDNTLLMVINGYAGQWLLLDKSMIIISTYGPLLFGAYLIYLWLKGGSKAERLLNRRRALYAFLAAGLALGINQIIGGFWFRERPYVHHPVNRLLPPTADFSFPSDHAAGAFSIASGVAYGRKIGGAALTVLAIMVALSRIYVGLHYPSDVLGGMVIGLISSWLIEVNKALLEKPVAWVLAVWDILEAKIPVLSQEQ